MTIRIVSGGREALRSDLPPDTFVQHARDKASTRRHFHRSVWDEPLSLFRRRIRLSYATVPSRTLGRNVNGVNHSCNSQRLTGK